MKNSAFRSVLACLITLALVGSATMAGDGQTLEATEAAASAPQTPRTLTYFANYRHDPTLMANLGMLMDACEKGYLTHVIVGLFHCDWVNRPEGRVACVSLNGLYLDDPTLQPIWETVRLLQSKQIKVIASFGGGGVGDYHHLLDPAQPEWYPLWRDMLKTHHFDGIDMDIEEPNPQIINTDNVKRVLKMLRKDFGDGFIITSAPVASALTGGSNISPGIDYAKLMKQGWFSWYNLQFYNGFGDLLGGAYGSPDYEAVLKANRGVSPRKFVAGVPTSPSSAGSNYHTLSALEPKFAELARKHGHFGGVYGWNFQEAKVEGRTDPVGWCEGVRGALTAKPRAAVRVEGVQPGVNGPGTESDAKYTYHELTDGTGIATGINTLGDVVGWYDQGGWHAFLAPHGESGWGVVQSLGTFAGGHGSQATGINGQRQIVGWSDDSHYDIRGFETDSHHALIDLGTLPGGSQSEACAIDDAGEIAGWSFTSGPSVPRAFFRDAGGTMRELGTLGGTASDATAIASSGTATMIAGWAQDAGGAWQACYLPPGETALRKVSLGGGIQASQVTALSLHPMSSTSYLHCMAGWALMPAGFDAFLRTEDYEADLFGTRIGTQAVATCVNSSYATAGWYLTGGGACRAFAMLPGSDQGPVDLNDLVENPPPGDSLMIATGINDNGWIVGQTLGGKPFVLTPKN